MLDKRYTMRKSGERMVTRHVKVHVHESATELVKEHLEMSTREAENAIMERYLDNVTAANMEGLVVYAGSKYPDQRGVWITSDFTESDADDLIKIETPIFIL